MLELEKILETTRIAILTAKSKIEEEESNFLKLKKSVNVRGSRNSETKEHAWLAYKRNSIAISQGHTSSNIQKRRLSKWKRGNNIYDNTKQEKHYATSTSLISMASTSSLNQ